eukprot:gene3062-3830_t
MVLPVKDDSFHDLFRTLPSDEKLIEEYSCSFNDSGLMSIGKLYISQYHVSYAPNKILGSNQIVIPIKDISAISKKNTAYVFPNAIEIVTFNDKKYFFTALLSRDVAFSTLSTIIGAGGGTRTKIFEEAMATTGGTDDKTIKSSSEEIPEPIEPNSIALLENTNNNNNNNNNNTNTNSQNNPFQETPTLSSFQPQSQQQQQQQPPTPNNTNSTTSSTTSSTTTSPSSSVLSTSITSTSQISQPPVGESESTTSKDRSSPLSSSQSQSIVSPPKSQSPSYNMLTSRLEMKEESTNSLSSLSLLSSSSTLSPSSSTSSSANSTTTSPIELEPFKDPLKDSSSSSFTKDNFSTTTTLNKQELTSSTSNSKQQLESQQQQQQSTTTLSSSVSTTTTLSSTSTTQLSSSLNSRDQQPNNNNNNTNSTPKKSASQIDLNQHQQHLPNGTHPNVDNHKTPTRQQSTTNLPTTVSPTNQRKKLTSTNSESNLNQHQTTTTTTPPSPSIDRHNQQQSQPVQSPLKTSQTVNNPNNVNNSNSQQQKLTSHSRNNSISSPDANVPSFLKFPNLPLAEKCQHINYSDFEEAPWSTEKYPITVEEFFNVIIRSDFWGSVNTTHSYTEQSVSEWSVTTPCCVQRTMDFRTAIAFKIGPKSTRVAQIQRCRMKSKDELAVECSSVSKDVPYGDSFSVENLIVVSPNPAEDGCIVRLSSKIKFMKTIWGITSMIQKTALTGNKEFFVLWNTMVRNQIETYVYNKSKKLKHELTKQANANTPTTPVGGSPKLSSSRDGNGGSSEKLTTPAQNTVPTTGGVSDITTTAKESDQQSQLTPRKGGGATASTPILYVGSTETHTNTSGGNDSATTTKGNEFGNDGASHNSFESNRPSNGGGSNSLFGFIWNRMSDDEKKYASIFLAVLMCFIFGLAYGMVSNSMASRQLNQQIYRFSDAMILLDSRLTSLIEGSPPVDSKVTYSSNIGKDRLDLLKERLEMANSLLQRTQSIISTLQGEMALEDLKYQKQLETNSSGGWFIFSPTFLFTTLVLSCSVIYYLGYFQTIRDLLPI